LKWSDSLRAIVALPSFAIDVAGVLVMRRRRSIADDPPWLNDGVPSPLTGRLGLNDGELSWSTRSVAAS